MRLISRTLSPFRVTTRLWATVPRRIRQCSLFHAESMAVDQIQAPLPVSTGGARHELVENAHRVCVHPHDGITDSVLRLPADARGATHWLSLEGSPATARPSAGSRLMQASTKLETRFGAAPLAPGNPYMNSVERHAFGAVMNRARPNFSRRYSRTSYSGVPADTRPPETSGFWALQIELRNSVAMPLTGYRLYPSSQTEGSFHAVPQRRRSHPPRPARFKRGDRRKRFTTCSGDEMRFAP